MCLVAIFWSMPNNASVPRGWGKMVDLNTSSGIMQDTDGYRDKNVVLVGSNSASCLYYLSLISKAPASDSSYLPMVYTSVIWFAVADVESPRSARIGRQST